MTKKDYVLIAEVFNSARQVSYRVWKNDNLRITLATIDSLGNALAYQLEIENHKFDRIKFLSACDIKPVCKKCGYENYFYACDCSLLD